MGGSSTRIGRPAFLIFTGLMFFVASRSKTGSLISLPVMPAIHCLFVPKFDSPEVSCGPCGSVLVGDVGVRSLLSKLEVGERPGVEDAFEGVLGVAGAPPLPACATLDGSMLNRGFIASRPELRPIDVD